MVKVKKICRICGKEYTPCSYCENDKMAFHYRTICCSRECAYIYLDRVLEARGQKAVHDSDQRQTVITTESTDSTEKAESPKVEVEQVAEKPKRKYTRKKQIIDESENSEQIEEVGTSN